VHGHPSLVLFSVSLRLALGDPPGRADNALAGLFGSLGIVVVKQHRRQDPPHVPLDVIRQHANKHVGPHPVSEVMINRMDLQVHTLQTPERALDFRQSLIALHHFFTAERLGRNTGTDDVDPIQRRFPFDVVLLALAAKAVFFDSSTILRWLRLLPQKPLSSRQNSKSKNPELLLTY
jgi:hypothetical protein